MPTDKSERDDGGVLRAVPIAAVRRVGKQVGADSVVFVVVSGERFAITTWGKNLRICSRLAEWAESDSADAMIQERRKRFGGGDD